MSRTNKILAVPAALALAAGCCLSAWAQAGSQPEAKAQEASAAPASVSDRFEKDGVRVDYTVTAAPTSGGPARGLAAGSDAVVSFRITDTNAGQPIRGLH